MVRKDVVFWGLSFAAAVLCLYNVWAGVLMATVLTGIAWRVGNGSPAPLYPLSPLVFLTLWQVVTEGTGLFKPYILPSPREVLLTIWAHRAVLAHHLGYTLTTALVGLLLSLLIGVGLAVVMHGIKPLEGLLYPLLVISQSTPSIAVAPLIILMFGFGRGPKIGVVVWATFFPITVNTLMGLRSVPGEAVDVLRAMGASRLQIFRHVVFPHTLAYTLYGLEITSPYAILGAITAEWMGTTEGLGLYIKRSFSSFELKQVFAGVIVITLFSLLLWLSVVTIRKTIIKWKEGVM